MNPGLMVGIGFVGATLVVIYLQLSDIRKARRFWMSIPMLPDYIARHPECATGLGIKCANCSSENIGEKGLASERDARRTFVCTDCGAVLYRGA